MKRRRLTSSHHVSEIGLGTAQLANTDGRFPGVKFVPPATARAVLAAAIEGGVTFFDTGDNYGTAEALLGELPLDVKRAITIATKAGRCEDGRRDFSPGYLETRLEQSRRRLGVDTIDVFQLNKPSRADLADGRVFTFVDTLKREGRIHAAGVEDGEIETGFQCLAAGVVDCVQVLYNLLYQETDSLIAAAAAQGVGVIVRSPLNSGVLSGAYGPATMFEPGDERERYFTPAVLTERLAAAQTICEAAGVPTERLLELALQFALSNSGVSTVIPGASSPTQAARYVSCAALPPLRGDERARLVRASGAALAGVQGPFQE